MTRTLLTPSAGIFLYQTKNAVGEVVPRGYFAGGQTLF